MGPFDERWVESSIPTGAFLPIDFTFERNRQRPKGLNAPTMSIARAEGTNSIVRQVGGRFQADYFDLMRMASGRVTKIATIRTSIMGAMVKTDASIFTPTRELLTLPKFAVE